MRVFIKQATRSSPTRGEVFAASTRAVFCLPADLPAKALAQAGASACVCSHERQVGAGGEEEAATAAPYLSASHPRRGAAGYFRLPIK